MEDQIMDRGDEGNSTSRSALRGACATEEGNVEVGDMEEINLMFFEKAWEVKLFGDRIMTIRYRNDFILHAYLV